MACTPLQSRILLLISTLFLVVIARSVAGSERLNADELSKWKWQNVEIERSLNVKRPTVYETLKIVAQNNGNEPFSAYLLPFNDQSEVPSIVDANVDGQSASIVGSQSTTKDGKIQEYVVLQFPTAVKPKNKVTISVALAWSNKRLERAPPSIKQTDPQFLVFSEKYWMNSTYDTDKQSITVTAHPKTIISADVIHAKHNLNTDNGSLSIGPLSKKKGTKLADKQFSLRYELTAPMITAISLNRTIDIPLKSGSPLSIREDYNIRNDAASLKGNFDRIAFMRSSQIQEVSTGLQNFLISTPKQTFDYYFIDQIGNVSTSRMQQSSHDFNILALQPRYPLFGGWKYSFSVGYKWALRWNQMKKDSATMNSIGIPLLSVVKDLYYENVRLSIVLPEGAFDVDIQMPVQHKSSFQIRKRFLDTVGHRVINIEMLNLKDVDAAKLVTVSWKTHWYEPFRRPVIASVGALAVLAVAWKLLF